MANLVSAGTRELLRPIRVPAYAFLGVTLVLQVTDFVIGVAPLRVTEVLWRFQTLGTATGSVGNVLLLLLLLYALALAVRDQRVYAIVGAITGLGALLLFLGSLAFVFDALELRGKVDPRTMSKFDVATGYALVKFLVEGVLFSMFASSARRAFREAHGESERLERGGDDLLVIPGAGAR